MSGGIFGFILITYVFKIVKGRLSKNDMYCNIKIDINEKSLYTNAIIDTGNFLREPITKSPVIVLEKNELINIVPDYILNNLDKIIIGKDLDLGEYASKIRIIPFTSLGRENGILLGIKADKVLVELEENSINIKNIIIGIYNGILSKNGKYHALIGLDIIEGNNISNLVYEKL
ncbi:MAG: sigma-E processing peptidase SpoIIGA [Clostridia bacterium]|nr:sigma-E processing peptidase SpoIIGA [Clostridia bacterium]